MKLLGICFSIIALLTMIWNISRGDYSTAMIMLVCFIVDVDCTIKWFKIDK